MTPSHQIAMPAQDGVRADEEPHPTQDLAGQRRQQGGEEGTVLGGESHSGAGAEPAFENGDLAAESEDLDVLVPIAHRQQPRRGEGAVRVYLEQQREHIRRGMIESMKVLDGSLSSSVSLLTGLSPERINELGGTGDWEE